MVNGRERDPAKPTRDEQKKEGERHAREVHEKKHEEGTQNVWKQCDPVENGVHERERSRV